MPLPPFSPVRNAAFIIERTVAGLAAWVGDENHGGGGGGGDDEEVPETILVRALVVCLEFCASTMRR